MGGVHHLSRHLVTPHPTAMPSLLSPPWREPQHQWGAALSQLLIQPQFWIRSRVGWDVWCGIGAVDVAYIDPGCTEA